VLIALHRILADFKLQLTSTDYGNFLSNETPPISTSTIAEKATERLVDEFNYVRSNAGGDLAKFLDYITSVKSSYFLWKYTDSGLLCPTDTHT
jgi:vacuolar-type H+-ATPase subunit C/Vma6